MTDLLTMTRKHDLPPRWDGRLVTWQGWEPQADAFVCPPRPWCCTGCGGTTRPVTNRGLVCVSPSTTRADLDADALNRAQLGTRMALKRPLLAALRLMVTRCPDCLLDSVWDTDTGEWWDLDHTDYGDEGSVEPPRSEKARVPPPAEPGRSPNPRSPARDAACPDGEPRGPRYCALCRGRSQNATVDAAVAGRWEPRTCTRPTERRDGPCGTRAVGWDDDGKAWCGRHRPDPDATLKSEPEISRLAPTKPTGRPTLTVIPGGRA